MWFGGMCESEICSGGAPPSSGEYEHKKDLLENKKPVPANLLGHEREHLRRYHPDERGTRPLCPYYHTAALITERLSVAHRAEHSAFRLPSEVHSLDPVCTAISAPAALCGSLWNGYLLFIIGLWYEIECILTLCLRKVNRFGKNSSKTFSALTGMVEVIKMIAET